MNEIVLSQWFQERNTDTGDLLFYIQAVDEANQTVPDILHGIVIRAGVGSYLVMPIGKPYFEDLRKVVPLKVARLVFPEWADTLNNINLQGQELTTDFERRTPPILVLGGKRKVALKAVKT